MWQVGRVSHCGQGAIAVVGPMGIALVSPQLLEVALGVVAGHSSPSALTSPNTPDASVFFVDLSDRWPRISAIGPLTISAWAYGINEPTTWDVPISDAPVDPGDWVGLDVSIHSDQALMGPWLPLGEGAAQAGSIRIGLPTATTPVPHPGNSVEDPPSSISIPTPTHGQAPPASSTPTQRPQSWTQVLGDALPAPVDPLPLIDEGEAVAESSEDSASVLTEPAGIAINPEAFEATMTPDMLEQLRLAETGGSQAVIEPEAQLDEEKASSEVGDGAPDPVASAFLIYSGATPVELVRDVIIGRDPDARAVPGSRAASTLRVPSVSNEISRSHCVVSAGQDGQWSVMDLSSSNGTILRKAAGDRESLEAMVPALLGDGDVVDIGDGVLITFRGRAASKRS